MRNRQLQKSTLYFAFKIEQLSKALRSVIHDHKGQWLLAMLDISTSKLHRRRINKRSFPRKICPLAWELSAAVVADGKRRTRPVPRFILIFNFLISSRPLSTAPKRSGLLSVTTVPFSLPHFLTASSILVSGSSAADEERRKGSWERAQLSSRSLRGSIHFSGNVAGRPHLSFKSRAGGGLRYATGLGRGTEEGRACRQFMYIGPRFAFTLTIILFPNSNDDSEFLSRRYLLILVCVN